MCTRYSGNEALTELKRACLDEFRGETMIDEEMYIEVH
jgi:hypothetical protein